MEYLSVGQTREEWRDFPDGYIMSYDAYNGMMLFFFLDSPEPDVLAELEPGREVEIGLADLERVGFFTIRFGSLPYGDCAFSPALYAPPQPLAPPQNDEGLPLHIVVVDSSTGSIIRMRTITLGHEFSVKFTNWFHNRMYLEMSQPAFQKAVQRIYAAYGTEDLRRRAKITCCSH